MLSAHGQLPNSRQPRAPAAFSAAAVQLHDTSGIAALNAAVTRQAGMVAKCRRVCADNDHNRLDRALAAGARALAHQRGSRRVTNAQQRGIEFRTTSCDFSDGWPFRYLSLLSPLGSFYR